eukprot:TRINITY_DN72990_c0_g1_i1.p1 TRINITY_DN72990_c0_g1~~TRINITY_DN72990_c0_g1_i1.p1  ORF type:complete len:602 (-),score=107.94 TRINITY_DN72990_c0_g1_i1:168-1973(-)
MMSAGGSSGSTAGKDLRSAGDGGQFCEGVRLAKNGGKVGLRNLGNTCFMNAGLQCLAHLEPLKAFFLTGEYEDEINQANPLGSKGELAHAFADLLRLLWLSEDSSQDPRAARRKLARLAPHLFEGYEQQDVQEFLAFCLDGLHEDLNRVTSRPPPMSEQDFEKELERAASSKGEEWAAAVAWMRYLERGKSFLVDLLQGQLRSTVTCMRCKHKSRRFEAFLYLSLPVARTGMSQVTDALEKYLEEETLTGDEQWYCEKCKKKVDAKKRIELWKLPPVLVLHLKRFEYDQRSRRFKKVDTRLSAPMMIDLASYCSSPQKEPAHFDVVAVANHIGAYGSGHYTATCRVGDSPDAWCYFDDDRVSPAGGSSREVVSQQAYVIFLVRQTDGSGACDGGGGSSGNPSSPSRFAIRRQTVTMPELWPHQISKRNSLVAELLPGTVSRPVVSGTVPASAASGSASNSSGAATAPDAGTRPENGAKEPAAHTSKIRSSPHGIPSGGSAGGSGSSRVGGAAGHTGSGTHHSRPAAIGADAASGLRPASGLRRKPPPPPPIHALEVGGTTPTGFSSRSRQHTPQASGDKAHLSPGPAAGRLPPPLRSPMGR